MLAVLQSPGAHPRDPDHPVPCDGSNSSSGTSRLGHGWTGADSSGEDSPSGPICLSRDWMNLPQPRASS